MENLNQTMKSFIQVMADVVGNSDVKASAGEPIARLRQLAEFLMVEEGNRMKKMEVDEESYDSDYDSDELDTEDLKKIVSPSPGNKSALRGEGNNN